MILVGKLGIKKTKGEFKFSASVGKTKLRDIFVDTDFSYKGIYIFYKEKPSSLFQESFNRSFGGDSDLESQKIIGLKLKQRYKLNKSILLDATAGYYRTFGFIDYNFENNSYLNLSKVENLNLGLKLRTKTSALFVQHQLARELGDQNRELPRRPPWRVGASLRKQVGGVVKVHANLSWVSRRKAFDGSLLEDFIQTKLEFKFRGVGLVFENALDQDRATFKNLTRRPFSVGLNYQKTF